MGRPLTENEKARVWLSTESGVHESLHAANPIGKDSYDSEGMLLEEALTEEVAPGPEGDPVRSVGRAFRIGDVGHGSGRGVGDLDVPRLPDQGGEAIDQLLRGDEGPRAQHPETPRELPMLTEGVRQPSEAGDGRRRGREQNQRAR